ncbi:MAG: alpha/beta hydrolase [Myxococcota bacterium]|nr:alpha/beta hydrolase [Myxococcota bacterium]
MSARCFACYLAVLGFIVLNGCATPIPPQTFAEINYPYPKERRVWSQRAAVDLYVAEVGVASPKQPSLVLLHPWGANVLIWEKLVKKLPPQQHVVLIDLPGHGKSGKPLGQYPPARMAAATLDVISALKLARPILVGNSLGGATAIETAIRAPDVVHALVVIGAPGGTPHPSVIRNLVTTFTKPFHIRSASEPIVRLLWFLVGHTLDPALEKTVTSAWASPRGSAGWKMFARAASSSLHSLLDWRPELEKIKAPTLVVQGQHDVVVWPWIGQELHERISNSKFHALDSCGHFPQIECLDQLMATLKPFVENPTKVIK